MTNLEIFRPKSGVISAWIIYIGLITLDIQEIFMGSFKTAIVTLAWSVFVGICFYLVLHRPKIEFFDEGIRITNPLKSFTFSWADVDSFDSKYSMSVHVRNKTIYAWAAPASGPMHARGIHSSELKGLGLSVDQFIRPSDSPRSSSGVATYLTRVRIDAFNARTNNLKIDSLITVNKAGLTALFISFSLACFLTFNQF